MMSIGRNDPCWCGSGTKYKHCHYKIDTASGKNRVSIAQAQYASNWHRNAKHFEMQGCYDWMASQLEIFSPKRILDIGCGDGSGILAITSKFGVDNITLISIDENIKCIDSAYKNISEHKISVEVINRMHIEASGKKHVQHVQTGKLFEAKGVTLVEADILVDDELKEFLKQIDTFDAITVWLIGTHLVRPECLNIAGLNIKSSGEYRLRVQNEIYELADKLLRIGGVLHVVDRGEVPDTEEIRNDFVRAHKEQASPTTLEFNEIKYFEYTEPRASKKISMEPTYGTSGRTPDLSRKAMISITSIKR